MSTAETAASSPESRETTTPSTVSTQDPRPAPWRRKRQARVPLEQRTQTGSTRRWKLLDRLGWYEITDEPPLTSTRQAEALNPALVATGSGQSLAGPPLGLDLHTGTALCADPHELYNAEPRRLSAPNVAILGDIGSGKSSLAKTAYVLRPLATGRQVCVFDRKRQEGLGEYHRLAAEIGGQVIRFDRAGGAVINVLDPRICQHDSDTDTSGGLVGQDRLLLMVAEHAHGELTSRERAALRGAHHAALAHAQQQGRAATISDVIDALYAPTTESLPRAVLAETGRLSSEDLFGWGLDLALDLDRFVRGDLSGLLDGPTQAADGGPLDLDGQLLVIDTSALDEDSPALSLVMAIMSTYLTAVWSQTPGQRLLVIEEGYHMVSLPGVAAIFRSLAKRGRGIGASTVSLFHHISDVPRHSAAMSLLRECGLCHVFRQSRDDDITDALALFGLPEHVGDELPYFQTGEHVLRIGSETPRRVQALRTALEAELTNTDTAMAGGGPR
jgi:hypothetical protein